MTKLSQQKTHHGIVLFCNIDGDGKGYGFIQPAGSDGSRESNVFFGFTATQGAEIGRGDSVDYILSTIPQSRGPRAHRIWIRERAVPGAYGHRERDDHEQITTLHGADEYT